MLVLALDRSIFTKCQLGFLSFLKARTTIV